MNIRHVASIADIVDDVEDGVRFYRDVLGLPVDFDRGGGYATVDVPGVLHFAVWSRAAAAESVLGDATRANDVPLGFTVGFEVDQVEDASSAIASRGWPIAQPPKREPWDQITSRFLSPSGALCEVAETPWARAITQPLQAAGADGAPQEEA